MNIQHLCRQLTHDATQTASCVLDGSDLAYVSLQKCTDAVSQNMSRHRFVTREVSTAAAGSWCRCSCVFAHSRRLRRDQQCAASHQTGPYAAGAVSGSPQSNVSRAELPQDLFALPLLLPCVAQCNILRCCLACIILLNECKCPTDY